MNSYNFSNVNSTENGIVYSSQTSPIRSVGIVKLKKGLAASGAAGTVHRDSPLEGGDTTTTSSSRGNPTTDLVSSPTTQINSPPCIWAGRSLITTPVSGDTEPIVLYTPSATLVGNTHPRDNNTWVRPIEENSTSLDICIHKIASRGKAVTPARVVHETAVSSSKSPPTPDRPRKRQNQNTTPERMVSSDHPFTVVKQHKQKQLNNTNQSVLSFSPQGLVAKAKPKPITKQNKKDPCCTCTERSSCANNKCACVKAQKDCLNCKCSKHRVNNFSSKLAASKSNLKSIQSSSGNWAWKSTASNGKMSFTNIQKKQSNSKKKSVMTDLSNIQNSNRAKATKKSPPASSKGPNQLSPALSLSKTAAAIQNPYSISQAKKKQKNKSTGTSTSKK